MADAPLTYPPLPPKRELGMGLMYEPVEGFGAEDMRAYVDADRALQRRFNPMRENFNDHNNSPLPRDALSIGQSGVGMPMPDDIAHLLKFYGAADLVELIRTQSHQIERLQAKLPQAPSFAPQRAREG